MSTPAFRSPLAVAVVGFLALAALLSALVGPPGSDRPPPDGSTESTSPGGLAAAAELLEAVGRQVIVTQGELPEVLPEHRGATHFIMDGGTVFRADRDALRDALAAGDRLVIANVVPSYLVRRAPQSRVAAVELGQPAFPHADFAGAVDIRTDGSRVWQTTGTMLPLVSAGDATLVAITTGAAGGEVVGLSDDVLISNESLTECRERRAPDRARRGRPDGCLPRDRVRASRRDWICGARSVVAVGAGDPRAGGGGFSRLACQAIRTDRGGRVRAAPAALGLRWERWRGYSRRAARAGPPRRRLARSSDAGCECSPGPMAATRRWSQWQCVTGSTRTKRALR